MIGVHRPSVRPSVCLMSRTSALTRKPKGLRRNFAQGYPRSHATLTPTSRSKGQKSRSAGAGAYCGGHLAAQLVIFVCKIMLTFQKCSHNKEHKRLQYCIRHLTGIARPTEWNTVFHSVSLANTVLLAMLLTKLNYAVYNLNATQSAVICYCPVSTSALFSSTVTGTKI